MNNSLSLELCFIQQKVLDLSLKIITQSAACRIGKTFQRIPIQGFSRILTGLTAKSASGKLARFRNSDYSSK